MADASSALRKSLYACLTGDAPLLGLLGGTFVYDEVPRAKSAPYLVIGEGGVKDWSTSLDRGHEHLLQIAVWSEQGGAGEANAIAHAAQRALEAMPPSLEGHHLVNIAVTGIDVKREANGRLIKAALRIRAVTETVL